MSTEGAGYRLFDLPGVKPGSDLEALFKAIGFVVVQWGLAEDLLRANADATTAESLPTLVDTLRRSRLPSIP
jgi:hypothetical protein